VQGYVNATGGFRTGILAAPLTGQVVAQVVVGEVSCYPVEAFSVARFAP
jgi:hydrogen cyanide synthase HcnC